MDIFQTIGYIIIGLSIVFMLFGIIGLFKFKDFYIRILVASKIDTVGFLTLIIGMGFIHGLSFFTAKLALIAVIMLLLNPLVAHVVARSAYNYGHTSGANRNDEHDTPS